MTFRPRFSILYADPPWRYRGGHLLPYPTMEAGEIAALPVASLCAQDCALFLWATYPCLPDALTVLSAWGFRYVTVAFTWVKRTPRDAGFHLGMGNWTRANPEICLLGTRGRPRRVSASVHNLIIAPRREHSRKPDEVRERIVALCGDLPRAELFARQEVPGWSAWGNEVACDFPLGPRESPRRTTPDAATHRRLPLGCALLTLGRKSAAVPTFCGQSPSSPAP